MSDRLTDAELARMREYREEYFPGDNRGFDKIAAQQIQDFIEALRREPDGAGVDYGLCGDSLWKSWPHDRSPD
jgi:hypothetical protein